jgi:ADP-ribosylglycohydrolase
MLTHNDRASTASCVALVEVLWRCLGLETPPASDWWLETFLAVERPLEGQTAYRSRVPGDRFVGPLWRFIEERVEAALDERLTVVEACDRWYSGAYLLETVPSVLYILASHGHDPEEAIVRAVNDTWDNDTIGAIVGAAMGALHGRDTLPARWRAGLLGRTSIGDDGRVFELIELARQRFLPESDTRTS